MQTWVVSAEGPWSARQHARRLAPHTQPSAPRTWTDRSAAWAPWLLCAMADRWRLRVGRAGGTGVCSSASASCVLRGVVACRDAEMQGCKDAGQAGWTDSECEAVHKTVPNGAVSCARHRPAPPRTQTCASELRASPAAANQTASGAVGPNPACPPLCGRPRALRGRSRAPRVAPSVAVPTGGVPGGRRPPRQRRRGQSWRGPPRRPGRPGGAAPACG
jgi:hypothetical protein